MEAGTAKGQPPIRKVEPFPAPAAKVEQGSHRPVGPAGVAAGTDPVAQEWERIFDAAGDAIFLTDREFRIARANRATSQLLNKPLDEIVGKTYWQAIHETDQPPETSPLAQAHHTKARVQGEIYVSQRAVWLEVSVDPMLDEKGDVTGVLHILRDVTAGKKMKEAMRESEEKYRSLFENAREAIVLTDLNGTITGVNRLVEDYGFQREELIGKGLFDFVAEDRRTRALADFKILLGGKPVAGEMEVITPRGVVSVEYRDNPILRGGQVVGVQAILTDVTKRKRAEQLLREERDRVQKYLDVAGVMLIVIDTEERVGLINKKGCKILGCTEEDVLGKNWFDHFLPPRIREHTRAIFDGLMAGQADENEYAEGVVLTQNGRQRLVGWHHTLLKDGTGRIIATLSSGEDITERKRAERRLLDYRNKLRELAAKLILAEEQERRRIAVGVHDQIGQRMALMRLAMQSLYTSVSDPSTRRPLEDICKDIDQVIGDANSLTFELSSPVLYEVGFANAVESWLVQQIHDRHGLEYRFKADPRAAPMDKDTGIALFQIVRELLANVVKHAKAKHVDVQIQKAAGTVQITVQDDGVGFKPSKVGMPDSRTGGYGLFSIRERLEYLGGNLKIESAPGKGTCISIAAPMQSRRKPRGKEAKT